jgi:hypothetical protein
LNRLACEWTDGHDDGSCHFGVIASKTGECEQLQMGRQPGCSWNALPQGERENFVCFSLYTITRPFRFSIGFRQEGATQFYKASDLKAD